MKNSMYHVGIFMTNVKMHVVISMKYVMTRALIFMTNCLTSLSLNLMNHVSRICRLDPFLLDRNVRVEEDP